MRSWFLSALVIAALFASGAPALSQMGGGETINGAAVSGGADNAPEARGRDYRYDDLRADDKTPTYAHFEAEPAGELALGADLVKQQKYADAIPHLERALGKRPDNATTLIYLGFSHRMIGAALHGDARLAEFKKALGYYQQALEIDSDNRLLHEYLGKIYLLMRDPTAATNELKTLETLCPDGCEERNTLAGVVASNMPRTDPAQTSSTP